MPQIINGTALAETLRREIAAEAEDFFRKARRRPRLAAVLVGEDPASHVYVRNKTKACAEVGIESESHDLAVDSTETQLLQLLEKLNASNEVDGILLQLPLPPQIGKTRALDSISPAKDVDGLHPHNVGLLVQGRATLIACTPLGVMEALKRNQIPLAGSRAIVVGRSDLVGKPAALLLLQENATVTVCHSKTKDLARVVSEADVVIAAMGQAGFLTPDFIREGAVVIDVGTTVLKNEEHVAKLFGKRSKKMEDFRNKKTVIAGDVHPDSYPKTSMYTPVPGGIGPLTITMLLRNTVRAAVRRNLEHGDTETRS